MPAKPEIIAMVGAETSPALPAEALRGRVARGNGQESDVAQPPSPSAASAALTQREILGRALQSLVAAEDFEQALRRTISACLPGLADFGFFDVVVGDQVRRTVAAHEARALEARPAATTWVAWAAPLSPYHSSGAPSLAAVSKP